MIINGEKVLFREKLLYFNCHQVGKYSYIYLTKNATGKINLNNVATVIATIQNNYLFVNIHDNLFSEKVNFLLDNEIGNNPIRVGNKIKMSMI